MRKREGKQVRGRLGTAAVGWAEAGRVPDALIRTVMRRVIAARAVSLEQRDPVRSRAVVDLLGSGRVTESPDLANRQHYEVPSSLFEIMLGPRLKYSSCLWEAPDTSLAGAEEAMLELTSSRARLDDGQRILELGCGWGSLTLWMAEHFPNSTITAVTNSAGQATYIDRRAAEAGFDHVQTVLADIADFRTDHRFDRVVSVEMLEHVRNYREMFRRIASWLQPDGLAFVHVFAHAREPYLFEDRGPADWMAREFFTGGVMPAHGLFEEFSDDLRMEASWRLPGLHYRETLEAWLAKLDHNRAAAEAVLADAGEPDPARAVQRWRMFLMACSELFGYQDGRVWGVSHYLMRQT